MQTPWWRERFVSKQQELRSKDANLVWLGDSITQDWERDDPQPWLRFRPVWDRFYGSVGSVNLGFNGDSTCHLLWRLERGELALMRPKVIVLLIGANNFGHVHTDADQTRDGILKILSLLHDRLPRARIILLGVLPSIRSAWVDANTRKLNEELRTATADDAYVSFVDATSIFETDGRVDPGQYIDPKLHPAQPALHPTAQAQARIAALIEPLVRQGLR